MDRVEGAAFLVDAQGTILTWNKSVERLLGFRASSVLGRSAYEALVGFGVTYCQAGCAQEPPRHGSAISPHTVKLRRADGKEAWYSCSVTVFGGRGPGRPLSLHQLFVGREPTLVATPAPVAAKPSTAPNPLHRLTRRERQILEALARGERSADVAHELGISPATVRNHVQNMLSKLGVSSRLEAVVLALERGARPATNTGCSH